MSRIIIIGTGPLFCETANLVAMMPNIPNVSAVLELSARYSLMHIDPDLDLFMATAVHQGTPLEPLDIEILATSIRTISEHIKYEYKRQTQFETIPAVEDVKVVGFDLAIKHKE
jgi:hypothetical protein